MTLNESHLAKALEELKNTPLEQPDDQTESLAGMLAQNEAYINAYIKNLELQNDKLSEEITVLKDDRSARKYYGVAIFSFVGLYILAVMVTLWSTTKISDQVLITLLGSTSINIIGLLMGVVRYLFPPAKE